MAYRNKAAREFARRIKALGFRVYLARDGEADYGFITDDTGARVLSFSFSDGGSLSGNYGPPSRESGTGWRLDVAPWDLRTAEDVRRALNASPPPWCGNGWRNMTTATTYLGFYASSRFAEVADD